MTVNLFKLANLESNIVSDSAHLPLRSATAVLEALIGPLGKETPEERALSVAVEMQDGAVAGASMERVIARRWQEIPLSVKGLWLQVAKSLRAQDGQGARAALLKITAYFY